MYIDKYNKYDIKYLTSNELIEFKDELMDCIDVLKYSTGINANIILGCVLSGSISALLFNFNYNLDNLPKAALDALVFILSTTGLITSIYNIVDNNNKINEFKDDIKEINHENNKRKILQFKRP